MKKEIAPLRKQGDLPEKVPTTFGRYYCDLCNTHLPLEDLRQCSICGRWACNDCWHPEFYLCKSCNGVAKMFQTKT